MLTSKEKEILIRERNLYLKIKKILQDRVKMYDNYPIGGNFPSDLIKLIDKRINVAHSIILLNNVEDIKKEKTTPCWCCKKENDNE